MPPLVLTAGVVGVAAIHGALGAPLGPAWAAEVWGLAKTAITAMLALSGAGAYIHGNNRRAWTMAMEEDDGARARRSGRLTPVEAIIRDDVPDDGAVGGGGRPRHASGRGGGGAR